MPKLYRIKELTLFDFFHSLTSLKGLVFIITYLFFWFLIFTNVTNNAVEWLKDPQGIMFASWLFQDQDLVLNLFVDRSATLSMYLLIAVSVTPFFMILAASNQFSSDASRGAFRFILTRATRSELFLSRFLSVLLLVFICILITLLWAGLQALINDEESIQVIGLYSIETFIIVLFYSLPIIAFMSMVSAFARTGFGSLFLGFFIYTILVIISYWLSDDIAIAAYLVPAAMKSYLFNINIENILISIITLTGYSLVYFYLGWLIFKQRDI